MTTVAAEHLELYAMEPIREAGSESWYVRAQNSVTVYSRAAVGAVLAVEDSEHEYFIILVEGAIEVTAGDKSATVTGQAQVIVPPGPSEVRATEAAVLVRVFAPPPAEMLELCVNAGSYPKEGSLATPHELWPEPVDGYRLRVYQYDQLPEDARIFRSRNIMVNWGGRFAPPRDLTKLTPHSHDDFEQVSMCISGEYIHHLRYPWGADGTAWLEDEHRRIGTPSVTLIPPPSIHTSQGVGDGNSLIDIFAPPRVDFSVQGRVYEENAKAYPLPPDVGGVPS